MKENETKRSFLNELQEHTWQMELLISGFVIVLLFSSYGFVGDLFTKTHSTLDLAFDNESSVSNILALFILVFLKMAMSFTIINLVIHLILRCLWVGALGLRSVLGQVDLDKMNFAPKFRNFLEPRIIDFDAYIERLEKTSSMIFAIAFLIIFILFSVISTFVFLIAIHLTISKVFPSLSESSIDNLMWVINVPFFIYLIDFISFGGIKRIKKPKFFARLYFPIYIFCSWISLSFIYRSLLYNLLDNKIGRKIILVMVSLIVLFPFISRMNFEAYKYLPIYDLESRDNLIIHPSSYEESRKDNLTVLYTIPSKIIKNNYLEIFLNIPASDNKLIRKICPDLKIIRKEGFLFSRDHRLVDATNDHRAYIDCVKQFFAISINDSLYNHLDFDIYIHPVTGEKGLLTMLDVSQLEKGKNSIIVEKQIFERNENSEDDEEPFVLKTLIQKTPFWKE